LELDQTIFTQEGASEEAAATGSIPTATEELANLIPVGGFSATHKLDANASW
jgi:hypothetical protein